MVTELQGPRGVKLILDPSESLQDTDEVSHNLRLIRSRSGLVAYVQNLSGAVAPYWFAAHTHTIYHTNFELRRLHQEVINWLYSGPVMAAVYEAEGKPEKAAEVRKHPLDPHLIAEPSWFFAKDSTIQSLRTSWEDEQIREEWLLHLPLETLDLIVRILHTKDPRQQRKLFRAYHEWY
jgi:hypothetical protein